MFKVYFLKDFSKVNEATEEILGNFYQKSSEIVVKIHFGEPGNKAAFTPEDIKPVADSLKNSSLVFTDTPVMYPSPRNTAKGYATVAKQKGFDRLGKILISDEYVKVKTKDLMAEVCKPLVESKNVLVVSHFKGHPMCAFGGAIKNLGMGGVSPKTKADEHNFSKPEFVKKCQGCGTCAKVCPCQAIKIILNKAVIIKPMCFGCSVCIVNCPYQCLAPKVALFDDLLAQGAAAVINNLPQKTFYITFLKNIVAHCDCETNPGETLSPDIGVLFSENPVAIDKASIDLINKITGKNLFQETHHKDPLLQINFVEKYTKWKKEYELVEI